MHCAVSACVCDTFHKLKKKNSQAIRAVLVDQDQTCVGTVRKDNIGSLTHAFYTYGIVICTL